MSMKTWKIGLLALPLLATSLSSAAVKFFNPTIMDSVPKTITETGIYSTMATKTVDTAVKYFEVNSALWSDAAHKSRWVVLPPGTHIPYNDTTDMFDYPNRTIFVKLFSHDTVMGDTTSRIYWETRLLVKDTGDQQWYGFSYKWNAAGTEASLVNVEIGLDTVLQMGSNPRYRKWHFPSQDDCYQCHRKTRDGRGVLGFLPPQLKRKAPSNASINQITHLANIGVFSTLPSNVDLGRRWRGIGEGVPTGLSAEARFRVIDTMARAYIAANCSGCHGTRGIEAGAIGHAAYLNYDFHTMTPRIEFGTPGNTSSLSLTQTDAEMLLPGLPTGRARMLQSLTEWNIPHGAGAAFDMKRPWFNSATEQQRAPGLISAGYPSFSTGIFRQLARKSPKYDSLSLRQRIADEGDSKGWAAWIFKSPWGSKAWLDTLKGRNVKLVDVIKATGSGDGGFFVDSESMPPLASYIPDTAAIKLLGEWAMTYRTLVRLPPADSVYVTRLNGVVAKVPAGIPAIRNGMLIAPEGWSGKASMISLTGRSFNLPSVGQGRYALPASAPAGVYVFRIGDRSFRTSVMR